MAHKLTTAFTLVSISTGQDVFNFPLLICIIVRQYNLFLKNVFMNINNPRRNSTEIIQHKIFSKSDKLSIL